MRGDDPLKIQRAAGHAVFQTTEGYIRDADALREGFGKVFPELPAELVRGRESSDPPQVPAIIVEALGIDPRCTERSEVQRGQMSSAKEQALSLAQGWRRWESNPGPQGIQPAFIHVRSRRIPCDWVRGFGRDLLPR